MLRDIAEGFSRFGRYNGFNLGYTDENGDVKPASLALVSDVRTASLLEREINSRLPVQAGYCARLVFDRVEDLPDGKYKYMIHVVPYDFVSRGDRDMVTRQILNVLPKILRNVRLEAKSSRN